MHQGLQLFFRPSVCQTIPQLSRSASASNARASAALAIPDPLRRQRGVPAKPRGHHADRCRDGLNQQAERDDQEREACARGVDVGLEPGFVCHAISLPLSVLTNKPFGLVVDFAETGGPSSCR